MKVAIIEDETDCQAALTSLLKHHHPEIQILGYACSVEQGVELIRQRQPETIFLDIQLEDGTGFDILKQVDHANFSIVFTTAHDDFALTAIQFEALAYLLKPVHREELSTALQKARDRCKERSYAQRVAELTEVIRNTKERKLPTRLAVATQESILYLPIREIIRMEADTNYTHIYFSEGKKLTASINIGTYQKQFRSYPGFMKVHRSHLVNLAFVRSYVKGDGGYLIMVDGSRISVSRLFRDTLLRRLKEI